MALNELGLHFILGLEFVVQRRSMSSVSAQSSRFRSSESSMKGGRLTSGSHIK
jgi:hypothetical protein